MDHSTFQLSVENKFDYMCKLVMNNEKNYYKQLSTITKQEVTFSDTGEYTSISFQR